MELMDKLEILVDAAKYDASCASSGAPRRSSEGKKGIGATTIPHSPRTVPLAPPPLQRRALAEHVPKQLDLWTELQAA